MRTDTKGALAFTQALDKRRKQQLDEESGAERRFPGGA